jgi:hypothetical protein
MEERTKLPEIGLAVSDNYQNLRHPCLFSEETILATWTKVGTETYR